MVYFADKDFDVPNVDLLTLLFDSPVTWLREDDTAHAEAALPSNSVTKAEVRTITKRLIHVFRHYFGIGVNGPGKDVVVVMSSGQVLLPCIFYSVIGAGGIYSAAPSVYTPGELVRQIAQGPSNLLVVSEDCRDVAMKAAREAGVPSDRVLVIQSRGGKRELCGLSEGGRRNYLDEMLEMEWERVTDLKVLVERPICLLYSSGTTGPPKGVHFSHQNFVAAGVIPQLLYREYFSRRQKTDPDWRFESRTIAHLPAAHIAGCQGYFVIPHVGGGTVYWMPKFDFTRFLEYNRRFRVTFLFSVPPVYLLIAKSPQVTDQFATLDLAITGAAPIGPELKALAESKVGSGRIGQSWGLSESTGSFTLMPFDAHEDTGSVSPLLPNNRLKIIDDDGNEVPEGTEGEFVVQGPTVTRGYWRNEDATTASFTSDGYFRTGDVGVRRDGKFYIVDRKKELIKYKGLQVAPAELEALLHSHPAIQDAAVIGVPDPDGSGNELPRAYVVRTSIDAIDEDTVKSFVSDNLAAHKRLRGGVVFLDVIPKSPSGKILRRVLRDVASRERRSSKL